MQKTKPNEKCPCGSGVKYKRCCGTPDKRRPALVCRVCGLTAEYDWEGNLSMVKKDNTGRAIALSICPTCEEKLREENKESV